MQQLSFLPGEMTPGERSLIQRALKTLDRHLHEPGVAFTSTRAAREWLILNMAGLEREEFRVLYLNNQNQLIAGETLFTGTFGWMDRLCEDYCGGIWNLYTLNNGGAFMAPEPDDDDDETWVLFNAMNGNRAEMSPEAAGIAACLMTYSHHACRTENYAMTVHYYRLRDYALQHPECSAIMRIID